MIYPHFSMQEISSLTDALTVWFDIEIDVFASSKEIIKTEDNFQVAANKTFDEFTVEDYSCLILPGILYPLPALIDEKNIAFLESLKGEDILISSISSSPILLAKAGLLDDVQFTLGLFEEIIQFHDFIPSQNVVRKPVVKDQNFITAIGFAFREFAMETIRTLGIDDLEYGLFNPVTREYTEEELTFRTDEANFNDYVTQYNESQKNKK